MALGTVKDAAYESAKVERKTVEQLGESYKRLHEQRLLYFKIEAIEAQGQIRELTKAEKKNLEDLKVSYKSYSSFRADEEEALSKLKERLLEQQVKLQETYIKDEAATRLQAEIDFYDEKIKIADARNKIVYEHESRQQKETYYAQRKYELELERLQAKNGGKKIRSIAQIEASEKRRLSTVAKQEAELIKQKAEGKISEEDFQKQRQLLAERRKSIEEDAKKKKNEAKASERSAQKAKKQKDKEEAKSQKVKEQLDAKKAKAKNYAETKALEESERKERDSKTQAEAKHIEKLQNNLFAKSTSDHEITLKDR